MKKRKVFWNNLIAIFTGTYKNGAVDLNTLCDLALTRIDRHYETPSIKACRKLTKEQKRKAKRFFSPYVRFLNTGFHRLYTDRSGGAFFAEYMPEEFYATTIDRYYTDRMESAYMANKCFFYQLFPDIKQPELIAMRMGNNWKDKNQQLITQEQLMNLVKQEEVVVKQATCSEGGKGVFFLKGDEKNIKLRKIINSISGDIVIQKSIKQHPEISALHKESVNTIRIISLLTDHHVKIYQAGLKIGVGDSRTDNGLTGGIYTGIKPDGTIRERGCYTSLEPAWEHPDLHYKFADKRVPNFENAIQLVKKAHPCVSRFRLISWDIAIDELGDAVLVEANFSLGGINELQICNGPLFGKDTKKILDEVFSHRKKRLTVFL